MNAQGLRRLTRVNGALDVVEGTWELLSDHIDLDGDGIAEIVDFESGIYKRAKQLNTQPPRLLTNVHNGRGAHTAITYASMHDTSTVDQNPGTLWTDRWGRLHPNASPRTQWVAKSLTTTDDFATTTSTTSYFYRNPRHGPDDHGKYSFRGFGEVTATSPSGARTTERYGYDVDWSGRLVETILQPAIAEVVNPDDIRSINRVTWVERPLFGGPLGGEIYTYHATVAESFICFNEQTEAQCTSAGAAAGYTRKTTTLDPLVPDGGNAPLAWSPTSSLLQASWIGGYGTLVQADDRVTTSTFRFKSEPQLYRLRPLTTESRVRDGANVTLYAKTATTWDGNYNVKLTEEVWVDANDANRSITHYDYDLTTGNLKKRWKPKQWATNKFTEYTYDSRQLFVATEVNELGHRLDYTYEYGTGTKLMTEGPNQRTCTTGAGCPLDQTHPLKEQHKVVVDGLGRTIETWDTVSDDGTLYELVQRSTTLYNDSANYLIESVRISVTPSLWKKKWTELDGHGRPIRETNYAYGSAGADHITVYKYRNDGTLATVETPDPTQNNTARVTYTYMFDSLGRPTMLRRPDGVDPLADQSGVNISYDGNETVIGTVTPTSTGGGAYVATNTLTDAFGRVVLVRELIEGPAWAATSYVYGPDDNVITVTDPEGVTTNMKHDFVGHRTEIERYGRKWKYTYDQNGNLESEMVPGSPNPPVTDTDYTTTFVYDHLDRPLSKVVGQRSLSTADQALFANRTETYEWDIGGNMIGYLRYWRSFSPNQSTAEVVHSTRFNNQGELITAIQNIEIAGLPERERRFGWRYHLFGGVSETRFEDAIGGTNKTIALTQYDARALPSQMVLKRSGEADQTLAVQTRNVAGLVTKRRTNTSGAMTFVESNWTYDKLGRVLSQAVQKSSAPTQIVRQNLSYTGHDNPKTLTHYLGADAKTFNFTFDKRHQLKTASSTTAGYFDATYDYGPGGRFIRATQAQTINPFPSGTEVKPRDVNYVYGDADPERLTALTNVSDGSTYAGYSYDAVGNVTKRCYGGSGVPACSGESVEFVYDGKDQLRRATKKLNGVVQGSEEYWYDGNGQRFAIVKRDAVGTKTEMIWFIGGTEAHYDGVGNITHIYSHLSLGTPVARVDRTSNTATSIEYQFHGLADNTIVAVAQNGTINASFSYAPFGEVIEATNGGGATAGTAAHKRRLNDKYEDDLTALTYYGARYYDKASMSWTQSDPLYRLLPDLAKGGTPRRANLYQFSLNNPLRYVDPDGKDSKPTLCWNSFAGCSHEGDGPAVTSYGDKGAVTITTEGSTATQDSTGPRVVEFHHVFAPGGGSTARPGTRPVTRGTGGGAGTRAAASPNAIRPSGPAQAGSGSRNRRGVALPTAGRPGVRPNTVRSTGEGPPERLVYELRDLRQSLGMPEGKGTLAGFYIEGQNQTYFGINAHGQPVPFRVNPISRSHSETDAMSQGYRAGVRGGVGVLVTDRDMCGACGRSGAVRSMGSQMGLSQLIVITPNYTHSFMYSR